MSSLIVEVVRIDEVLPHPDPAAERIAVAVIKGWRTVIPKVDDGTGKLVPKYEAGDEVIYVPPDAMLKPEVAEHWGVTKYLGQDGRVKSAKLRGQMSYGFLADVENICGEGFVESRRLETEDPNWLTTWWRPQVGDDVAGYYSIEKWEPGENFNSAELEPENPSFRRYTDIELFENFPEKIGVGTEVVVTEKLHGCLRGDSMVRLANGEETQISDIQVGTMVLAWDDTGSCLVPSKVLDVVRRHPDYPGHWMRLSFENGRSIVCTDDHKILTSNRGWVPAGSLDEDDDVVGAD